VEKHEHGQYDQKGYDVSETAGQPGHAIIHSLLCPQLIRKSASSLSKIR
jgi:hypothetical protein